MECKKDGEKEGGGALNKATRSVERYVVAVRRALPMPEAAEPGSGLHRLTSDYLLIIYG